MPDLDDVELQRLEIVGMRKAEAIIRGFHPLRAFPGKDELGVVRHGYGRPIERRPISERVALVALREEMVQTVAILRPRVFELKGTHPEIPDDRIAVLYALADLLGPAETRDWSPLWDAMRRQDWATVTQELLNCHMLKLMSDTQSQKRQVSELIVMMLTGNIPATAQ